MAKLPSFIDQLQTLVATPSVSSTSAQWDMGNRVVIDTLATWFEELGFKTAIQVVPSQLNKANLIATLGTGDGGLVFAGHTDTVPFNEELWQSDPLVLTERDGGLYGLGSTDMKGFFPVVIEALRKVDPKRLKQPIIVVATADEESSMDGARLLAERGLPAGRACVIGEPTGLRPIRAHKGVMMEMIRITGRAGHSSNPALGINALDAMYDAIGELLHYRQKLAQRYRDPLFAVDHPTINLGHIHGGDNPNRICGHCELHFDVRMMPGMEIEEVRREIANLMVPVSQRHGVELVSQDLIPGAEPFIESANSELVNLAEQLTQSHAQSVGFATEAPYFKGMGLETIVMGPGNIEVAHKPDEFMPLEQIRPAVDIFQKMIAHYCY